jgi:hypothetical protein
MGWVLIALLVVVVLVVAVVVGTHRSGTSSASVEERDET